MARWLHVSARLMTGSYHGAEWPPSPARLFQALLAGQKTWSRGTPESSAEAGAFLWLEAQPAPVILAPEVVRGVPYALSVPLNNWDLLGREWTHGREPTRGPDKLRSLTDVRPWHCVGEPGSVAAPTVHYLWALDEEGGKEPDSVGVVCTMASRMLALGWGIDLAVGHGAVLSNSQFLKLRRGLIEYVPMEGRGNRLAVPAPGWTDQLESHYTDWQARTQKGILSHLSGTVGSGRFATYVRSDVAHPRSYAGFRLESPGGGSFSWPWREGIVVAGWLRHAAGQRLKLEGKDSDWISRYAMGHGREEERNRRLSYVPLPSIGHPHADGEIRRALLVEPLTGSEGVAGLLAWGLGGTSLTDDGGRTRARALDLEREDPVLRRYTVPATLWASVTPVLLHGHDHSGRRFVPAKAERLLREAFEQSGYDPGAIAEVGYQSAPLWSGTGHARECRVPSHLSQWPRFHVSVRFRRPVPGPVLVGIGRHYGLGLFASLTTQSLS